MSDLQLNALTVLLVALFVIPSRLVFAPLGAAGSPAQMIGTVLLLAWVLRKLGGGRTRTTALHWALLAFAAAVLASYISAALRPIAVPEVSSADRGLLAVLGWSGLFLGVADGIANRAVLDTFLRRLVIGGGFVAVVGVLQFITKQQLTDHFFVPGLSDTNLLQLNNRNGFTRPDGTAIHPIEFGAVLTVILPIALHYALIDSRSRNHSRLRNHSKTPGDGRNGNGRSFVPRWWPVAAMSFAIPLSISRSAIISAVVMLIVVLPTLQRQVRRRAYLVIVALSGTVYVLVPGLLGTITGLFTNISGDNSTASRTDSYALVGQFVARYPVFGRGFRTFLVNYRILDNQYLGLLVEVGFVGLAATFALFLTAIVSARRLRRASADPATRSLAQALLAAVASTLVSIAVYDAFSFPMATNVLFIVLGSLAALVRVSKHVPGASAPARGPAAVRATKPT